MAAESKSSSQEFTFEDHMKKIMNTLNISSEQQISILEKMEKFNDKTKFTIMKNDELNKLLEKLLESDNEIKNLFETGILKSMQEAIKPEWNTMLANISKLQGYIILQKVQSGDCSGVIKALMEALNKKIDSVNSVLEANINSAGVATPIPVPVAQGAASAIKYQNNGALDNKFREKYLKYKLKYIKLKSK